jgi:hypothetical protein
MPVSIVVVVRDVPDEPELPDVVVAPDPFTVVEVADPAPEPLVVVPDPLTVEVVAEPDDAPPVAAVVVVASRAIAE